MALHRRHLLTVLGTTGVAALAGCPSLGGNDSTPETDPPLSEHTTKFAPADGGFNDFFGGSVAVSADGTTALVGAYRDDDAGSAYVFEQSGGSWRQQAKLAPADGDLQDASFGWSVAIAADGTTALVGASLDVDPNGSLAGAAYVFERSGGSWTQQAKFAAGDGDSRDWFGWSVAMAADGETAIVGAPKDEDPNGTNAGSAYAFTASSGSWTQQANLAAAAGDENDRFGESVAVAVDGTTALVGVSGDEDPNGKQAGAAYVFERAGDSWTQQAKFVSADGDDSDDFGRSVAMAADGTTALVGAHRAEDPNDDGAGLAYVVERAGDSWTQQAKLAVTDGDSSFGGSVAVAADGRTAIVGAPHVSVPNGAEAGAAFIFERSGGSWHQQAKFAPADGDSRDNFGETVGMAADGTTALVGAESDEDPNGDDAGSAYVFERADGSWPQ